MTVKIIDKKTGREVFDSTEYIIQRVARCEHTGEEVEQELEESGLWLCLHNNK
jgi:Na+-transporting NADH:ubiquinone oxidoreductase subunit NqrA